MSEGIISWSKCDRVPAAGIMAGCEACPNPKYGIIIYIYQQSDIYMPFVLSMDITYKKDMFSEQ